MRILRISLRVVFYREEGEWVAHCLEFDLLGSGETKQEALECLSEAIHIQVEESLKHGNPSNLFSPADGEFLERFAAGKEISTAELSLSMFPAQEDGVIFERTEVREYTEDYSGCDLVPA